MVIAATTSWAQMAARLPAEPSLRPNLISFGAQGGASVMLRDPSHVGQAALAQAHQPHLHLVLCRFRQMPKEVALRGTRLGV